MDESGKSMHVSSLKVSTPILVIQLFLLFTVLRPNWWVQKMGELVTIWPMVIAALGVDGILL